MSQGCWKGGFVLWMLLCLRTVLLRALTNLLQLISLILFHAHSKQGPAERNQTQNLLLLSLKSHQIHNWVLYLLDFWQEVQKWMPKATSAHLNPVFQKLSDHRCVVFHLQFEALSTLEQSVAELNIKAKGAAWLKEPPPSYLSCSQLWTSTVLMKDNVVYQPRTAG